VIVAIQGRLFRDDGPALVVEREPMWIIGPQTRRWLAFVGPIVVVVVTRERRAQEDKHLHRVTVGDIRNHVTGQRVTDKDDISIAIESSGHLLADRFDIPIHADVCAIDGHVDGKGAVPSRHQLGLEKLPLPRTVSAPMDEYELTHAATVSGDPIDLDGSFGAEV
jgi:hypothetical protein